jgi:hypothetical protein
MALASIVSGLSENTGAEASVNNPIKSKPLKANVRIFEAEVMVRRI